jgi:hypothetical protein
MTTLSTIQTALLVFAMPALGQSVFQNLDFESATVVTDFPPNIIDTAAALPNWTVLDGTSQMSIILYNSNSAVSLWGSGQALDGNFSVGFNTGGSISQTCSIPADARTLLFIGTRPTVAARLLRVSISGQLLPYGLISIGPDYVQWGADISAFAGQPVTLTFSGGGLLDDIQCSPSPIPEPSLSWLLFAGSGVLLYVRGWNQPVRS